MFEILRPSPVCLVQQLWWFLPAGSALGAAFLQAWHPAGSGSPRALAWCSSTRQSSASPEHTQATRSRAAAREEQGLAHPGSRLRLDGPCRAWIWNWQQTHRVLFVNIDLRLQDGHGRALLHSFTHTRPEVGPCEVGALMLQRTPAMNRGTARG